MVTAYLALLALLAAERVFELHLSRRNRARALARGGIEVGQAHFRWMRLLHSAFFASCALEVLLLRREIDVRLALPMLALALAAQGLRYWAIAALGDRWNVRVIVMPGRPVETGGPYRWLRHPMYVGVLLGLWATPRMSFGHLLLALALTAYVLIAMRYEERDLLHRFGRRYADWRGVP